jgi:Adenylate and Guanylate cyclase catalytic domain
MTPHYCLFGDMVNVTARHESTGLAGKIQCSSELFTRLTDTSRYNGEPHYIISARGLVYMKGKGDCMTYLLQGGTHANPHAGPAAIRELHQQVGDMLQKKDWKRRSYFRSSGALRGDDMDLSSTSGSSRRPMSTTEMTDADTTYDSSADTDHSLYRRPLELDTGSDDSSHVSENERSIGDIEELRPDQSNHATTASSLGGLAHLVFSSNCSKEELVSQVHMILSPLLESCSSQVSPRERQDTELLAFVEHISITFQQQNN